MGLNFEHISPFSVWEATWRAVSGRDRRHERLYADDVHDTRQIIGEHVQCHLAGNLRQRLHQKVRRAHLHLQCAGGVLNRLAPLTHGVRLHGFAAPTETRAQPRARDL